MPVLTPFWIFALAEGLAVALLLLVALAFPRAFAQPFLRLEKWTQRIARRNWLAFAVIAMLVVCVRLACLPLLKIPYPAIHDEFSYLLAGDTFALGRLTNPPHPMWVHFESFHIIQQPTYQSMYPPAQGLALAFGKVIFGDFWFGVLFSSALMCSIFYWAFAAWVPRRWAFAGAIVVALRIGVFSYWMNSYWGGAVAAIGGALVIGAWPRIRKSARIRDVLFLALGLSILANSRPFEGLLFALPVGVAMMWWIFRQRTFSRTTILRNVLLPLVAVMAVTLVAMGIYFHAVTGSAFRMPFSVNRATYAVARLFIWQKPLPIPEYRHLQMRVFYIRVEYFRFLTAKSLDGFRELLLQKSFETWAFFLGTALLVPLLTFTRLVRDRRFLLPIICIAMVFAGSSFVWFYAPHYLAPAVCAIYIVMLRGLQNIRAWRRRDAGVILAWGIPVICVLSVPLQPAVRQFSGGAPESRAAWWTVNHSFPERQEIQKQLQSKPGKQLVIVRYARMHSPETEWVYNRANIDASDIVWARDMGAAKNQELLNYFHDRHVWLLEPDRSLQLIPNPPANPQ